MIKSRSKYFAIFSWRQFVGLVSQLVAAARLGLNRVRDAEAEDGAGSSGAHPALSSSDEREPAEIRRVLITRE